MKKMAKKALDFFLGNSLMKKILISFIGRKYLHPILSLTSYRGCHMVNPGETCVLAGIFNASTIESFLSAVGKNGKVIIVEAGSGNVKRLKEEIASSIGLQDNLYFVNKAVWNKKGSMGFISPDDTETQGFNRLASDELQSFPYHLIANPKTIDVETDTLDSIAEETNCDVIHHVNLTINGAELQALDGISEIVEKNPQVRIYINSEYEMPCVQVLEKLKNMNFNVFTKPIKNTTNKRIKLVRIYAYH